MLPSDHQGSVMDAIQTNRDGPLLMLLIEHMTRQCNVERIV